MTNRECIADSLGRVSTMKSELEFIEGLRSRMASDMVSLDNRIKLIRLQIEEEMKYATTLRDSL